MTPRVSKRCARLHSDSKSTKLSHSVGVAPFDASSTSCASQDDPATCPFAEKASRWGFSVEHLRGKDRLIVALDVPTVEEALAVVDQLDNVSFFKVGLQLFMTGGLPTLLQRLTQKEGRQVFADLKVPGDIANTISGVVQVCVAMKVTFLTLSESMPLPAIAAAKAARDTQHSSKPKLLTVPFLSSLDATDLGAIATGETSLETFILKRAHAAVEAGCDGIIASGQAIKVCRTAFPRPTIIVSPAIRPAGSSHDDHKRFTTPAEAMRLGADYLVVGRPILKDPDPREAAQRVIAEIDGALGSDTSSSQSGMRRAKTRSASRPAAIA